MITTVTLNPAIDQRLDFDSIQLGKVNRVINSKQEAGGKGINVSKVLRGLGEDSTATGFIGGGSGVWINNWLKMKGIKTDFVLTDTETRTNLKLIDHNSFMITDINHGGDPIKEVYLKALYEKVGELVEVSEILVLSGSLPKATPSHVYKDLMEIANKRNCITILDAEGEALLEAIEGKPHMIKPNIHELESTFKVKINNEEDIINKAKFFLEKGVQLVVVSMGEEGAMLISNTEVLKAETIKVEVSSTVGAGDSMVAAFAYGIKKGLQLEETFKLAIASATLSVSKGTTLHDLEEINNYVKAVKIKKLK
ncbi:1-phosphofructokinase [Alkaliphilus transvaalensis]|uniref:1-phosphofructokinase n=1 Tax=Alkaliphilus transvaalensis TaxID=114628 RepID=UPI0004790007|nr:1-phosphofructokinase [Alkaliphilus transvaalensis]